MSCDACGCGITHFVRDDGAQLCKRCFHSGRDTMCQECQRVPGTVKGGAIFDGGIFCDECWEKKST